MSTKFLVDPPQRMLAPPRMTFRLMMEAARFGATSIQFPSATDPLSAAPFTLGAITGRAVLTGGVDLRTSTFHTYDTVELPLAIIPDREPTVADLLEAFGAQITR